MKPRTIGSRLLIIAATVLAITIAGSAEAKHGGEGGHGGGWGWHGGEAWHGGEGWHGGEAWHGGWGRHGGGGWDLPSGLPDNRPPSRLVKHRWGGARGGATPAPGSRPPAPPGFRPAAR